MSFMPPVSAFDPGTQTFPVLTSVQIDRIRGYGRVRHVEPGEILFKPGDSGMSFFILLSGGMEIVQPTVGGERQITTHGPGAFTGEISMLSGQKCMVLGRVTNAGEFIDIPRDGLRAIVGRDVELSDIIMRAFILRRLALIKHDLGNVIVMGSRHCANTLRLREFLGRNGHPYTYVDLDTDKTSQELLDRFGIGMEDVPVVICNVSTVLRNPPIQKLAECLGLSPHLDATRLRDLVIVGAGPAGLAAAVYAASEGLDTLLIEHEAPGGQAGSSSKIENYLGFPTGISGQELAARALHQAQKFGATMVVSRKVARLDCDRRPYRVLLDDNSAVPARAIVLATGAQYNRPKIHDLQRFEGQGVYYGATYMEAQLCEGEDVIVIGGGNSAGQAAIFLSQTARKVYMLVRSDGLADTMSRYLIQRITENPAIEIHYRTEVTGLHGDRELESVTWTNRRTNESVTHPLRHLFIMTGAAPRTEWLRGCVSLDDKGFIVTGRDLQEVADLTASPPWPLIRPPHMLETSLPGVFAVGDVRSGNVKRVASAVGEGAISVHLVHRTLAEL
jgi:thioredoxin reductase (NADPH)